MNRIICDICGTAYSDSASCCPICGASRQSEEKADVAEQTAAVETAEVTGAAQADAETAAAAAVTAEAAPAETVPPRTGSKTKGGHFSKKNVKKRLRSAKAAQAQDPADEQDSKGLKWLVAVLAVAVLVVGGYIGVRFWQGRNAYEDALNRPENTVDSGTEESTEDTSVACTQLDISMELLELTEQGAIVNLGVTAQPEDTTDVITYVSSDEAVVTVDECGNVTAVAPGSAVITVTCGEMSRECLVTCVFAEETEDTTGETEDTTGETEETTEVTITPATGTLSLNKSDVTLRYEGESFSLSPTFNGSAVALAGVTWTSSDESVATVDNGKVTGVGYGKCTITASYNGVEQSCVVRCSFKTDSGETTEATEGSASSDSNWSISKEDVTISVGESFSLKITNSAGETANVSWSVTTSGVVSVEGNTVTGLKSGKTTLSATVDGVTYSCIVRVK